MTVRPFPWASLDSVSREEVVLLSALARVLGAPSHLERASDALTSLIGRPLSARLRSVEPVAGPASERDVAVVLTAGEHTLVVQVELALAVEVVAGVLKRPSPPLAFGSGFDAVAGAFAAVLLKALRRTASIDDVRVLGAGTANTVVPGAELPDAACAVYTVLLDPDAFDARILFSQRAALRAPSPPIDRAALARLGDLRLAVPVVAAHAWVPASELRALGPGDAFVPGALRIGPSARYVLASARCDRGLAATLEASGRLVVGNAVEDLTMSDAANDTLLETALDAPVVVRVEVGSVSLSAREWASLKPGDVVSLEQRVGAEVVLRAAGAELGRGELVDVDGELGVRLISVAEAT